MQSRQVTIAPRPMSKLEAIRSEMVPAISVRQQKKKAPSAPPPPPPPKRIAHSIAEILNSSSSDVEDDSLDSVKESLKEKHQQAAAPRSVKLVDIDGSSTSLVNPDIARLQKERVKRRDGNVWQQLQRYVLNLNFDTLGLEPDNNENQQHIADGIPLRFASHRAYMACFEPLLFMETKAQILQAKEECDLADNVPLTLKRVGITDDFYELEFGASEQAFKSLTELDYVHVSYSPGAGEDGKNVAPVVGIVSRSVCKRVYTEVIIRLSLAACQSSHQLHFRDGTRWCATVLCNLITASREYQALAHLDDFGAITRFILNPSTDLCINDDSPDNQDDLEQLVNQLMPKYALNRPQSQAVVAAVTDRKDPFCLIQGPPGTGKTRVIEAIVRLIFSNDPLVHTRRLMIPVLREAKRIMVCAPSNAAVDEIIRRLTNDQSLKVVRIGSPDMIDDQVKHLSIDNLVEAKCRELVKEMNREVGELRAICSDYDKQLVVLVASSDLDAANEVRKELMKQKQKMKRLQRDIEDVKVRTRQQVLLSANVIGCTLSGAGHDTIARIHQSGQGHFDFVIVDEACQAVELSTLIPLQWGAKKVVLVGDPNQLPPTVISQSAISCEYDESLFKRLQRACPDRVKLLTVQYRMHPDISSFPSVHYYQSRLVNGPNMAVETARPWHRIGALGPYRFFDIAGSEDCTSQSGKSRGNQQEAVAVCTLIGFLFTQFPDYPWDDDRIGVITPYKEQKRRIERELALLYRRLDYDKTLNNKRKRRVEVSTIDGFQGQEREIIIFSSVRSAGQLGFLKDVRRMNVALTRAKSSLFLIGNAEGLTKRNKLWQALVNDARDRGMFVPFDLTLWRNMRDCV